MSTRHIIFMQPLSFLWLVIPAFLLSACDTAEHNLGRAGQTLRENYDNTRQRVSGYIYDEPEYASPPPAPAPVFCYRMMMDVVCYDRPKPESHLKLVAVQGYHDYQYEDFIPQRVLEQYGTGAGYEASREANIVAVYGADAIRSGQIMVSDINQQPQPGMAGVNAPVASPFGRSPSPSAVDNTSASAVASHGSTSMRGDVPVRLIK